MYKLSWKFSFLGEVSHMLIFKTVWQGLQRKSGNLHLHLDCMSQKRTLNIQFRCFFSWFFRMFHVYEICYPDSWVFFILHSPHFFGRAFGTVIKMPPVWGTWIWVLIPLLVPSSCWCSPWENSRWWLNSCVQLSRVSPGSGVIAWAWPSSTSWRHFWNQWMGTSLCFFLPFK